MASESTQSTDNSNMVFAPIYSGKELTLRSSDGKEAKIPIEAAFLSKTIKNIVDDCGDEGVVDLGDDIRSDIMELVIKYCDYHTRNPHINAESIRIDRWHMKDICQFDKELCNLPTEKLHMLMAAGDYLNIEMLTITAGKFIAKEMKRMVQPKEPGDPVEKLRQYTGQENNFTPEQEAELRKVNRWVFMPYEEIESDEEDKVIAEAMADLNAASAEDEAIAEEQDSENGSDEEEEAQANDE